MEVYWQRSVYRGHGLGRGVELRESRASGAGSENVCNPEAEDGSTNPELLRQDEQRSQ